MKLVLNNKQAKTLAEIITHFNDIDKFVISVDKDKKLNVKFDILNTIDACTKHKNLMFDPACDTF
jgi:hypothetical protein